MDKWTEFAVECLKKKKECLKRGEYQKALQYAMLGNSYFGNFRPKTNFEW